MIFKAEETAYEKTVVLKIQSVERTACSFFNKDSMRTCTLENGGK